MRCGIIVAAAFAAAAAAMSATGAQAEEWCGFSAKPHAIVQCGYSSLEGCQNTIGKGAMCFLNPYVAFNEPRIRPANFAKQPAARG